MKLGFSRAQKSLILIIHPSEIANTIDFFEYLKSNDEREDTLISDITKTLSSRTDPDECLMVNINASYIDFSIRLVSTFIQINEKMGTEVTNVGKILNVMEASVVNVH